MAFSVVGSLDAVHVLYICVVDTYLALLPNFLLGDKVKMV